MEYKKNSQIEEIPLVSAVITTRNRKDLLQRAVESVLSQSYRNIELIVVDDGSTDGTEEWCLSNQFKYIRIPIGKSKGGNYARNLGIKEATGKYVAFLDDDDYWLPQKTLKQVEILEHTGNELVHCGRYLEIVNKDGSVNIEQCKLSSINAGRLNKRILYQITCITSTILVERKALMEIGGFDENLMFWQEYELSIRLAQRKSFDIVGQPLVVYRINEYDKSRLTNKYEEWKEAVQYIYNKHSNLYGKLNIFSKLRVKLQFWRDSSSRAKACGLDSVYERHRRIYSLLSIPFRVCDKIISYI